MAAFIGCKAQVITNDGGVYKGIIQAIDTRNGRITLKKVYSEVSKKNIAGIQHYFPADIKSVTAVEEKNKPTKTVATDGTNNGGRSFLDKKETPAHLKYLREIDRKKMYKSATPSCDEGKKSCGEDYYDVETFTMPTQLPNLSKVNCTIIGKIGDAFESAVSKISQHKFIGLCAEGVNLGRYGKLMWLQIGLPDHVYLFDMQALKSKGFVNGLGNILQNPNIQKVVHNCRKISDILWHQNKLKLVNVFDTQVAEILIEQYENYGDLNRYVSALFQILPKYLAVPLETIPKGRFREIFRKNDEQGLWGTRPASDDARDVLVYNVVYLVALRHVQLDHLLAPFRDGVDIFLADVRDEDSKQQHQKKLEQSHWTPNQFCSLARSAKGLHHLEKKKGDCYDQHGFYENDPVVADPQICFSRDGIVNHPHPDRLPSGIAKKSRSRSRSLPRSAPQQRSPSPEEDSRKKESLVDIGARELRKQKGLEEPNKIHEVQPGDVQNTMKKVLNQPGPSGDQLIINSMERRRSSLPPEKIKVTIGGAESTTGTFKEKEILRFASEGKVNGAAVCALDEDEEFGIIPDHTRREGLKPLNPTIFGENKSKLGSNSDSSDGQSNIKGRLPKCASYPKLGFAGKVSAQCSNTSTNGRKDSIQSKQGSPPPRETSPPLGVKSLINGVVDVSGDSDLDQPPQLKGRLPRGIMSKSDSSLPRPGMGRGQVIAYNIQQLAEQS